MIKHFALLSRGDHRDALYAAATTKPIPKKFSLRDKQTPVVNQNGIGICVPCALCSTIEPFYKEDLSECWIYQRRSNAGEGMELREALKLVHKQGTCTDSCFPLSSLCKRKVCTEEKINEESKLYKITSYHRVFHDIPGTLYANQSPIFAAIPVYSNWGSDGHIPMPGGDFLGYHGICITGYDLTQKILEFKNSWGSSWGDNGYGYLPLLYPIPEAWVVKIEETPPPITLSIVSATIKSKSIFGIKAELLIYSTQKCMLKIHPGLFNFPKIIHKGMNRVILYIPYKLNKVNLIRLQFYNTEKVEYEAKLTISADLKYKKIN